MGLCVPVRDMKDTAAFARLVREAGEPVTVTKNGYSEFVVMRSEEYDFMREELAKARLLRILIDGDRACDAGDYADGEGFTAAMREKYGL